MITILMSTTNYFDGILTNTTKMTYFAQGTTQFSIQFTNQMMVPSNLHPNRHTRNYDLRNHQPDLSVGALLGSHRGSVGIA